MPSSSREVAGQLTQRVTIEQDSGTTQDTRGEPVENWTTFATVWAAIEPLTGREFFAAQQVIAAVDTRIRIRYRPGVVPKMRVKDANNVLYDIAAVLDPSSRHEELQLLTVRRGA